ncbi:UAA transporter, partial [Nowakowskiella sp. JEL0078]
VIFGVILATFGEYEFSIIGLVITLLGVLLSSIKGITTNQLLVGRLKLHPMVLLCWMSALSFIQCGSISYFNGEIDRFIHYASKLPRKQDLNKLIQQTSDSEDEGSRRIITFEFMIACVLTNGFLAFLLNYVSFTAIKKTSALSMTVAGNVKQALGIVLSIWLFGYAMTPMNGLGTAVPCTVFMK